MKPFSHAKKANMGLYPGHCIANYPPTRIGDEKILRKVNKYVLKKLPRIIFRKTGPIYFHYSRNL